LGPNSNGVISTAGAGLQGFFLNSTGGTTTITGSQSQGAFNLYEFLGDATAGGGAYVLTDFSSANSAIFLLNGTASGPSDATVSTSPAPPAARSSASQTAPTSPCSASRPHPCR
jgi:hypothetical protein